MSLLSKLTLRRVLSGVVACTIAGCAVGEPASEPGLSLRFAALSGGCQPTGNGSHTVPDTIETLVVVLKAAGVAPKTIRATRASVVKTGSWLVKGIPITDDLDIEVYGCDSAKTVRFAGQSNDAIIESQKESTLRAFLLPVNKVACTGDSGLDDGTAEQDKGKIPEISAGLPKAAALAVGTAMPSGDVVVSGGIGEWTSDKKAGIGTRETARYDHHTGHFRRGPLLREARIWHHALRLDAHRILIAGGVGSVNAIGSASGVATPVLVPANISAAMPGEKAEIIDDRTDDKGQPKVSMNSAADIGAGANLLSSATRVGDELLFVGGVDTSGEAVATATRLTDLGAIADGKAGTTAAITLAAARIRPALITLDDGTVIVWGGAPSEKIDDMGEVIKKAGSKGEKLKISGDKSLIESTTLAAVGASATLLSQSKDTAIFLVAGGMPFSNPLSASAVPSYVVILTKATGEAELKPMTVDGKPLFGGLGMAMQTSPDGHIVIAGGLIALSAADPCEASAAECLLKQVYVLVAPADTKAATVDFKSSATLDLGAGQFGVAAAPLPMGVLLAGGQAAVVAKAPDGALTSTARVVVSAPKDEAVICGK
ncbi:MAG: hypothetical protein KC502_07040 [Myxococcales bacterium]|nr:hypothetical protein [Myxococcales bacterium]